MHDIVHSAMYTKIKINMHMTSETEIAHTCMVWEFNYC